MGYFADIDIQSMPPPQVNTLNCLILDSKMALKEIPQNVLHYFVNSKRRFFVYFKYYEQMIETMRILAQNNVRFYRRESILPDREEHQELVYHCNYRYKRQDLRKNLYHSTPYNEPKLFFDKYQRAKMTFEQPINLVQRKSDDKSLMEVKESKEKVGEKKSQQQFLGLKNEEVAKILTNHELLREIFRSMNRNS